MNINFFIPKDNKIPINLALKVDDIHVNYKKINNGFEFDVFIKDKDKALDIVKTITSQIKSEQDESEHGVSWRDVSYEVKSEDSFGTGLVVIEWKYRIRDSY